MSDKELRQQVPTVYRELVGHHGQRRLVQEALEEASITPAQRAYTWALDIFSVKPTVEANVLDILQVAGLTIPAAALAVQLGLWGMWVAGVLVGTFVAFFIFYFGILVAANSPMGWTYLFMRLFCIMVIASLLFI